MTGPLFDQAVSTAAEAAGFVLEVHDHGAILDVLRGVDAAFPALAADVLQLFQFLFVDGGGGLHFGAVLDF